MHPWGCRVPTRGPDGPRRQPGGQEPSHVAPPVLAGHPFFGRGASEPAPGAAAASPSIPKRASSRSADPRRGPRLVARTVALDFGPSPRVGVPALSPFPRTHSLPGHPPCSLVLRKCACMRARVHPALAPRCRTSKALAPLRTVGFVNSPRRHLLTHPLPA